MADKINKSPEEWKKQLSPEQFAVTRNKGTEPAFSGQYWDLHEKGVFRCVCCATRLFDSEQKYDSGSGWPSFWAPADQENVAITDDLSHGMRRLEVTCKQCDAHLGHLFPDGPKPTNLRYCINSAALRFEKQPD